MVFARQRVCPAHAGIGRFPRIGPIGDLCLPRARGDRPSRSIPSVLQKKSAPRTRGSALGSSGTRVTDGVCPAHAGIGPFRHIAVELHKCLPRARGDRPSTPASVSHSATSAPRTRGSAVHLRRSYSRPLVCPAHAGIGLDMPNRRTNWPCLPRARGDRPHGIPWSQDKGRSAPRTRGSAEFSTQCEPLVRVCPAHAGIGRSLLRPVIRSTRLPRARGDRPC